MHTLTNINTNTNSNTNYTCFHNSHKGASEASRRPLGLKLGYATSRAHDNSTSRSGFHTPTGSSKASRRPLGLKMGYASSRAHNNNDTKTNINNNHNYNNVFVRARQQTRPVARV
jgi:hypothetical protein